MNHDHETPQDVRDLAGRLSAMGATERRTGEDASERVAVRSLHVLRDGQSGTGVGGARLRSALLWLGGPTLAAAAVLLAFVVMSARPWDGARSTTDGDVATGTALDVEMLAAGLERDLDSLAALDSFWSTDGFESSLAAVALDAATLGDSFGETDPLTSIGSDS